MSGDESIGTKILALRKAKGITQAELGAYLNVSYQAAPKISEAGKVNGWVIAALVLPCWKWRYSVLFSAL